MNVTRSFAVSVACACALLAGCADMGHPGLVTNVNAHGTAGDIVAKVQKLLASCRGYSAEVEIRSLDPNGGFNHYRDEQNVSLPDRMLVSRTILEAHNQDQEGASVTTVVDRGQLVSRMRRAEKWGGGKDVTYRKTNLIAVEQAGGPSARDVMAGMGNLADPFSQFDLSTLTVDRETSREWVLIAEFGQPGSPWRQNRITIDKATGFLSQIEAIIPELGEPVVVLKANKVSAKFRDEDKVFSLDIPPPGKSGSPYVTDDTHMWIESLKAQKDSEHKRK